MLDLLRHVYFYTQSLENDGETEYWIASNDASRFDRFPYGDARGALIRSKIDTLSQSTCRFPMQGPFLQGQATLLGDCQLTLSPITLDVDGRFSPVIVLFNVFGASRRHAARTLRKVPVFMGRELNEAALDGIDKLQEILALPRPVLLFRLLVARVRRKN